MGFRCNAGYAVVVANRVVVRSAAEAAGVHTGSIFGLGPSRVSYSEVTVGLL
jgi:hypothetical protein